MLINKSDFTRFDLDIPSYINTTKLNRAMREAEEIDLPGYFNQKFMYDFKTNITDSKYQDILNGGTYVCGDNTIDYEGLKATLCYFAYARLISNIDLTLTYNAAVIKNSEHSERADSRLRAQEITKAEQTAKYYLSRVMAFIECNLDIYTLYSLPIVARTKYKVIGE